MAVLGLGAVRRNNDLAHSENPRSGHPELSTHTRSLTGFITTAFGFRLLVHIGNPDESRRPGSSGVRNHRHRLAGRMARLHIAVSADGLVHFAYNVAMPALLLVTIAQEPARNLLEWRFLLAFGGGSILCFMLVFLAVRAGWGRNLASSTIYGMTAAMTNTGFVALPILHSLYGQPAVLPAAVATVFVAAVMFPATVILLEIKGHNALGLSARTFFLAKQIVLNPLVLSTLTGLAWAIAGWPIPAPIATYLNIFAAALTPCALFAIGLGLSLDDMSSNLRVSIVLAAVKLVIMPLIVYGLCVATGLNPLYTIAAIVCAAVPTAKTVYILAGEYKVEEPLVAATISITTLLSVATLLGWLYALSGLGVQAS